ncbi:MAG: hypothetical protein WCQ48_04345 [Chloroflexota bacterium]
MSATAANTSATDEGEPATLSNEIRDGLLQDLLAVGLILRRLECAAPGTGCAEITSASAVIEEDVRVVRGIIDRLRAA